MQGNGGTIQVGSKSTLAWKNVSTPLQVDLSAQAEKTVVLGKYNGSQPILTFVTAQNQIHAYDLSSCLGMLKSTAAPSATTVARVLLNVQEPIQILRVGKLHDSNRDVLCVGTERLLLVYDVENNTELLGVDVADGIRDIAVGDLGESVHNAAKIFFVGGGCSLLGYDQKGNEVYWNMTGDVVSAMEMIDMDGDSVTELVVASEDREIRVFKGEEVVAEYTESGIISKLCAMGKWRGFGFANDLGGVGVYRNGKRIWRDKLKSGHATAIVSAKLPYSNDPVLFVGTSEGLLQMRNAKTGICHYEENFGASISGIFVIEPTMEPSKADQDIFIVVLLSSGVLHVLKPIDTAVIDRNNLESLTKRKQTLLNQLEALRSQMTKFTGVIEPLTVQCIPYYDSETATGYLTLRVKCSDTQIKMDCVAVSSDLWGNEWRVAHTEPSSVIEIPISMEKDCETELRVKVYFASPGHVRKMYEFPAYKLPNFSMYALVDRINEPLDMFVTIDTSTHNIDRSSIMNWLKRHFLAAQFASPYLPQIEAGTFQVWFRDLRNGEPFSIAFGGGQLEIRAKTLAIPPILLQSLYNDFQIVESTTVNIHLNATTCQTMTSLVNKIQETNSVKQALSADISDMTQMMNVGIVRVEDAMLLNDFNQLKTHYGTLFDTHRSLELDLIKQSSTHTDLVASVKAVNQLIQQAADCRVGKQRSSVIMEARNAVRAYQAEALVEALGGGGSRKLV